MKKILIVGASGLVGGNCRQYFTEKKLEVIGTHLNFPTEYTHYFDATNLEDSKNEFVLNQIEQFDCIIHCGALTHVDYCEDNIEESYQKTVDSTKKLLGIASEEKIKFIYISTDYVFDGESGPYKEEDTTNPINVYGKHKLEAEREVIKLKKNNYLIARITNVYGKEIRGKNFVSRIINNTLSNKKLKLPVDQYATPVSAYDVARALYKLIIDDKQGIYHIGSTDYMNRYQLASKVVDVVNNRELKLLPICTKNLKQKANRPLFGGLLSAKFLAEYPTFKFSNIDEYLNQI